MSTIPSASSPKGRSEDKTNLALLEKLANGWRAASADAARDFLSRWKAAFSCDLEINEIGDSWVRYTCDLGAIRFRGMQEASCLLLAAGDGPAQAAILDFWSWVRAPGKAVFVLALSEEAALIAKTQVPKGRCVLLTWADCIAVLESRDPVSWLKLAIRAQIPLERLIPFDTEHVAEGHMFSGRSRHLRRLEDEDSSSFAIAGPSRIGKTSLIKRYQQSLKKAGAAETMSYFFIDLLRCPDKTPDGVTRFIMLHVDGRSTASRLTSDRVEPTLAYWKSHFGMPVGLLLDEVDEVLAFETFRYFAAAAKSGYCRLILGGKGVLLRTMLQSEHFFQCRVQLLRLEPLSDQEAKTLLVGPIHDLGFALSDGDDVVGKVLGLTGKLPHLVQYYGRCIAQSMIEKPEQAIGQSLLERVRDSYETFTFFSGPLFETRDAKSRFVALSLLGKALRPFRLEQIQRIVSEEGLPLSSIELWEIVNELVILNVLAWDHGAFQIANESLHYYAQATDFFKVAWRETREALSRH
jgi:hypothetical protein